MGAEARARLGLLGLATAILITFNQLFEQQDFAGPSILGMLAALGIAAGSRRLGLWPSTTILLSLVCLVGYLALIFQAPHTFYGLPTVAALRGLGRSVQVAYSHSHVDFAPVPLRPGYAVLTTAAMWILVAVAEVAAFRWRRPILATLPAIALFAFVQVVGTQRGGWFYVALFLAAVFTFWALESANKLRSWGRPIRLTRGRRPIQPPAIASGLARKMGASCVAAALVVPVFLPAIEEGLVSWRTKTGEGGFGVGSGPGSSGSGRVNPLVSLVPQLINQSDRELFRVRAKQPAYWKLVTLTRFDGQQWSRGSVGQLRIDPSGLTPYEVRGPGRSLRQDFSITSLEGRELPLAGLPRTIVGSAELENKLYIDPASADVTINGMEVTQGMRYSVDATLPAATFEDLQETEVADPPTPLYVETPELSPAVRKLAQEWTAGAETDVEKLAAIQSRLRGFDYSIDLEKPTSSDYLEEFLLETRVGYCQQFATAFAVLARNLGFPTRVVVGFLPGRTDIASPDNYVVTGNETHAWPEVLFKGYGWIRFEPTPRQEASAPLYTLEEVAGEPATISGAEAPTGSAGGVRNPQQPDGGRLPGRLEQPQAPQAGGAGTPEETINTQWQQTFGRIALVLVVALLLFLGLVPLAKRARVQARYARAKGPRDKAAAAFSDFEQAAAALAFPRARAESASRYAQRIARDAAVPLGQVTRLASIYEAAEYAAADISPLVAEEAHRLAAQLKRRLWAQAGWWQRMKRLWSPAGLVPGGRARIIRQPVLQKVASLGRS